MTELIFNRSNPCNCGCRGNDPWHARTFRRVVRRLSDTEGAVRLPMSTQPVRVTRTLNALPSGDTYFTLWTIDRASIIHDK